MSLPIVGLLTIGQSSRDDLFQEMKKLIDSRIKTIEAGVLDDFSEEEIAELTPSAGEFPLITKIRGNKSLVVSKNKISTLLEKKINHLHKAGAELVTILCTTPFDTLPAKVFVLKTGNLLNSLIAKLLNNGKLGVLIPLKEQVEISKIRWKNLGIDVVVEYASPYGDLSALKKAASRLSVIEELSLLLMDCLGYSLKMKEMISSFFQAPIILPRTLLSSVINELVR
jgi:protein AroM